MWKFRNRRSSAESPDEMAEEASTGGAANNQPREYKSDPYEDDCYEFAHGLCSEIGRPAPDVRVPVEVAEEASTDDTTNERGVHSVSTKF